MKKLFFTTALLALLLSLQACQEKLSVSEPAENYEEVLNKLLDNMDTGLVDALVSDDERLLILALNGKVDSITAEAMVVFKNDDDKEYLVNEQKWREKYGYTADEPCPLFNWRQQKLYTLQRSNGEPVYIVVTNELCDYEGQPDEGMFTSAHAYTISDGELRPIKIFQQPDGATDAIRTDAGRWLEWVQCVPSLWPSSFNKKKGVLRIARMIEGDHSCRLGYDEWRFSKEEGFQRTKEQCLALSGLHDITSELAMTEELSQHKVLIGSRFASDPEYFLALWPVSASWGDEPSVVAWSNAHNDDLDSYQFKADDGLTYVVQMNLYPEGDGPSIRALEVYKGKELVSSEINE